MTRRAIVAGCGGYLPERILTNDEIAARLDTSDAWIRERTGIAERRIAATDERTSDLAAAAARAALAAAGRGADEVDLIVVATTTPDLTFPATAAIVQEKIGAAQGAAFDVQAVCTGFVHALSVAEKFIAVGEAERALVIGAEIYSRILDWTDRSTCVLFGDGAGAFVLEAGPAQPGDAPDRGVLATFLRCDGRLVDLLYVDGGPSSTGEVGHLRMQGNKVFREAVGRIAEAVETTAAKAGVSIGDVDWFVPHQANARIIDGVAKKLKLREDRVISTIARQGNTSAASIPLAYAAAVDDGRIKQGDLVMLEAMGGGLTWGAALLRA